MKTDTTKLFDEMLKDNAAPPENESQMIEQQINEKIKASIGKMQADFDKKLKESEEKLNNILSKVKENNNEESNNREEAERTGTDKDIDLSDQKQEDDIEG